MTKRNIETTLMIWTTTMTIVMITNRMSGTVTMDRAHIPTSTMISNTITAAFRRIHDCTE